MKANRANWRFLVVVPLLVFLCSCGGGGGGDDGGGGFSGVYDVSLIKMEDDCEIMDQNEIQAVHNVTHNGNAVTLVSGQVTMHGHVVRDDSGYGFDVAYQERINAACIGTMATVYRETAQVNSYGIGFTILASCADGSQCQVGYGGTATKR